MHIDLPDKSVRLHETAPTMAMNSVVSRMYGLYNVRPGYFYPQSPYGRSLGIRGLRGLGFSYYDLLAQAGMEDCDPKDSACVSRNVQRQASVEDLWVSTYETNPNTANAPAPSITVTPDTSPQAQQQFMSNQPVTTDAIDVRGQPTHTVFQLEHGATAFTPSGSTGSGSSGGGGGTGSSGGNYSPRVVFQTSTGDTGQLKPGDTWTINITGGKPNAPVAVTGGQNGAQNTTPMGSTDGNGNWQANGSIDTSMLGNWAESWTVGGTSAGSFSFTVVAATQAQGSAATGKPNQSVPPGNPLVPGDTGFCSTGGFLQSMFCPAGATATGGGALGGNTLLLMAALGIGAILLLKSK